MVACAQRLHHIVGQRRGNGALVLHQVFHRFGVVLLAPGFADGDAGGAGVLDDRLEVRRQACPFRLVDDELAGGRHLMPAGRVVILRDLVQAELAVEEGADEFGRVDHAALEVGEDFARRDQAGIDAKLLVDAPGETRDAHLDAVEVVDGLDLLAEPAGHLHAGIAAIDRHQIEAVVDLAPQLGAAAVIVPAVEALEIQAEGNGGEILRGEALAGPEIGVGVVHLDGAGRHRVEAFRRRDQFARAVELDLEAAARHVVDALDQILGAARPGRIEGSVRAVEARHLPIERGLRLDDRGRGDRAGRACQSQFGEISTTHGNAPLCLQPPVYKQVMGQFRPLLLRDIVQPFMPPCKRDRTWYGRRRIRLSAKMSVGRR